MSRIRINELARELEVKPGVILEMLPEIGITEKKTHSSSVEDEDADKVRRWFRAEEGEPESAALQEDKPFPAKTARAEQTGATAGRRPRSGPAWRQG